MSEHMFTTPTNGWQVLYYRNRGVWERGEQGAPAMVIRSHDAGQVDLNVISLGAITPRPAIRYVDDPWHTENPGSSAEQGCWDWSPAFPEWWHEQMLLPREVIAGAVEQHIEESAGQSGKKERGRR